ncbi:hypothetical protein CNMCM5793_006424 [Aspergillus hiratsukae]|uniref:Uncharacterized protein n=1 Tax=Aspergillus hiratsukae TaxID=1194566 RepID=A0A8H6PHD3_9EURO|nr:hypothetical protein CNMCM5793_006424 [Aspergillus hiratsukae]
MPRPVVNYHRSRLLQRFGLTRRSSPASINSLSVGQAMLLRTLLLTLMNRTRHSHDYSYRISAATQLEILSLVDQLKRRIHEANAIALFAAFGMPHNANMTHLAALDLMSLEMLLPSVASKKEIEIAQLLVDCGAAVNSTIDGP